MTKVDGNNKKSIVASYIDTAHTEVMTDNDFAEISTTAALRLALGPGFGAAGPSERLLMTVVNPSKAWARARR